VEIAGWGGHLAVYVDGRLELQYRDEKFLRSGTFAFETLERSHAQVDDIEVRESGEEPEMPYNLIPVIPNLRLSCESTGQTTLVTTESDTDRMGMDYWGGQVLDPDVKPLTVCQNMCIKDTRCQSYTFRVEDSYCWLKEGVPDQAGTDGLISGVKACVP